MPSVPLFYQPDLTLSHLTTEESHHAIRVLRMRIGAALEVTDGLGTLASAELTSTESRKAAFKITNSTKFPRRASQIHLAVAPTKNIDRMEWMVEKCTEIGVDKISFVRCHTSERPKIPLERLIKVAVSAMKQSEQVWMPELGEMLPFDQFLSNVTEVQRFIAHVDETNSNHLTKMVKHQGDCILLVGPEGDFTKDELDLAISIGFTKVSLGQNRLRTETAAIFGVVALNARGSIADYSDLRITRT